MAIVEIKLEPTKNDLRWFGLVVLAFFALLGGIIWLRTGSWPVTRVLWLVGGFGSLVYYSVRPLRRLMYVAWMRAVYPLGLTISHLILGTVYFLLVTPLGLLLRAVRGDPLHREFDPDAASYWNPHEPSSDPARYFRQF